MGSERAFYVTQGSMTVWQRGNADAQRTIVFPDNDDGLRQFDAYLDQSDEQLSFVVVDVIEEEFALEKIPKVGMRDRKLLMERRVRRKFPRTPYRLPVYHGRESAQSDEAIVVHSAISNHELLDPWLQIILRHELPLTGIHSVSLMGAELLAKFRKPDGPALILTQHQHNKLRQVFLQRGMVQSARLSQSPSLPDEEYPSFVITEIGRSRRYLERGRLLSSMEPLDVYIVADAALAERILACAASDSPLKIHFIGLGKAAKKVGLRKAPVPDRLETLYLAMAFGKRPKLNYAVSGETRFWKFRRLRHSIIGLAASAAAVCSVLSGVYLSDAWHLHRRSAAIEQQVAQLTETFRRENERFDPMRADSHEMKLAVDTGDFILANRVPVPWVMQQLGFVMGDYPDIRIETLGWSAESAAVLAPPPNRRGQPQPVPVPAITAVSASISARITPFDGDMRKAFARIDALAEALQSRTEFSHVTVSEYPLDARPQSSLAGEIVGADSNAEAGFRLLLRFSLDQQPEQSAGATDERA